MKCFRIDLSSPLKISLSNLEHLVPPRPHITRQTNSYILYFITKGELILKNNENELSLKEGDIYIFSKGDIQSPTEITDCEYHYVHFDGEVTVTDISEREYSSTVKNNKMKFAQSKFYTTDKYRYMSVLIPEKIHIDKKITYEHFLKNLRKNTLPSFHNSIEKSLEFSYDMQKMLIQLEQLSVNAYENKDAKTDRMYNTAEKLAQYLGDNYLSEISSLEIEKELFVNYNYANRIFKKIFGKSIVKFRNELRIEHAKLLLLSTEKSVQEIARESGFTDKYYFSRLFTKSVGISPRSFRESEIEYVQQ